MNIRYSLHGNRFFDCMCAVPGLLGMEGFKERLRPESQAMEKLLYETEEANCLDLSMMKTGSDS